MTDNGVTLISKSHDVQYSQHQMMICSRINQRHIKSYQTSNARHDYVMQYHKLARSVEYFTTVGSTTAQCVLTILTLYDGVVL